MDCRNKSDQPCITILNSRTGFFMISGTSLNLYEANNTHIRVRSLINYELTESSHECLIIKRSCPYKFSFVLQIDNSVVVTKIQVNFLKHSVATSVLLSGNIGSLTTLDKKKRTRAIMLGSKVDRIVTIDTKRKSITQISSIPKSTQFYELTSYLQLYKVFLLNNRLLSLLD
jgi:hypothetical protein